MSHLITPVILAGGKGSRLWPLTSRNRPKPFLRPFSGHSLFQETLARVQNFNAPTVITEDRNLKQAALEAQDMPITPSFVLEPEGRGTAAALILAAMTLQEQEGLMLVMPSDHAISDPDQIFSDFIQEIMHHAMASILLIGVAPSGPDPRYGYIEVDRGRHSPYPVFGFKEKPQAETAREIIEEGNCLWNTGMFLAPPVMFLQRCAALKPRLYNEVKSAFEQGLHDQAVFRPHKEVYLAIEPQSIDRAILQRCPDLKCCPLPLPWYDVGCWSMFLRLKFRLFLNRRL